MKIMIVHPAQFSGMWNHILVKRAAVSYLRLGEFSWGALSTMSSARHLLAILTHNYSQQRFARCPNKFAQELVNFASTPHFTQFVSFSGTRLCLYDLRGWRNSDTQMPDSNAKKETLNCSQFSSGCGKRSMVFEWNKCTGNRLYIYEGKMDPGNWVCSSNYLSSWN